MNPTTTVALNRKRIVVLLIILLVIGGALLVYFGIIKNPLQKLPSLQTGPKVSVKTTYKNPFNKDTQYVNPFQKYKNPFVVNR